MRNILRLLFPLAGLLPLCAPAAENDVTPEQVVAAMEESFGVHPGERRNHIRGVCAIGQFVGNPEAGRYSRSPLFSGRPIPVVARFSVAGGNPKAPDTARTPRGMALEFRLPGGGLQHMTMINTPIFGAATPRTFYDLTVASRPDPATGKPDPDKLKAFRATHPDNADQARFLETHNPPASYADSAYFGIHTFKFLDRDGRVTPVRWKFVPQHGERRLSDEEMKSSPPYFLEDELLRRVGRAPVRWDMVVTVGEAGDPENDPTQAWPEDRRSFNAGTLTVTAAMSQKGAECEAINYDPLVMADGMAPSDDPVLRFRSPAYAVSVGKRLSGR